MAEKNPNYLSYSGVYMATTWRFSLITFSHYNLGHHQGKTDILTFSTTSCQFCWLASYSGCYKAGIYNLGAKPWPLLVQLSRKYCSFSVLDNCYTSYSIKISAWIRTSCSGAFNLEVLTLLMPAFSSFQSSLF